MGNGSGVNGNLITGDMRTPEEMKEIGRKGGIASGIAKKNKKLLKDCLLILLENKSLDDEGKKTTGAEKLTLSLFQEALAGDTKAFEIIRDTVGEKPTAKLEAITQNVNIVITEEEDE